MTQYVTRRPRAWWDDDDKGVTAETVYETIREHEETGLLNARGEPLYRAPDVRPMGFKFPEKS